MDRLSRLKVENQGRAVSKRRNARATLYQKTKSLKFAGAIYSAPQIFHSEKCRVLDFAREGLTVAFSSFKMQACLFFCHRRAKAALATARFVFFWQRKRK